MLKGIKVSVIIPTYGGAKELERAICSVLNQTYKNIEVIVVDDNNPKTESRYNTERIVNLFKGDKRLNYLKHEKNKNGAAARNTGIEYSSGKYICFLDDDDFYMPERIAVSVEILENNPEYDAILCNVMDCTDSGLYGVLHEYKKNGHLKNELLSRDIIMGSGSNIFITHKAAINLGGFDVDFQRLQDDEFMVRFYRKYKAIALNKLMIIKARNGVNNEPKLEKLYNSRNRFFEKYKDDISELNKEELYKFYNYHYTALLNSSYTLKDSLLKRNVINKLKSIRNLSKKEKFKLFMMNKYLGRKMFEIYERINLKGHKWEMNNSNLVREKCTEEERRFIDSYLCYKYAE